MHASKRKLQQICSRQSVAELGSIQVIHATMHLASTMATIHVLLRPGGHIVFNEAGPGPGIAAKFYTYIDIYTPYTGTHMHIDIYIYIYEHIIYMHMYMYMYMYM